MLHIDELETLGNIILLIKTYRHQTRDYSDLAGNKDIDAYLNKHLSGKEYAFWINRHANRQILSDNSLSLQQFKLLMKQYKRAGYESGQFRYQISDQLAGNP